MFYEIKIVSFFSKQNTNISVANLSSFRITSTERARISKTNPIKDLRTATITSHGMMSMQIVKVQLNQMTIEVLKIRYSVSLQTLKCKIDSILCYVVV